MLSMLGPNKYLLSFDCVTCVLKQLVETGGSSESSAERTTSHPKSLEKKEVNSIFYARRATCTVFLEVKPIQRERPCLDNFVTPTLPTFSISTPPTLVCLIYTPKKPGAV